MDENGTTMMRGIEGIKEAPGWFHIALRELRLLEEANNLTALTNFCCLRRLCMNESGCSSLRCLAHYALADGADGAVRFRAWIR